MNEEANALIDAFWRAQNNFIEVDDKHALPLARIKRVMKLDNDIKSMMISHEAPVLLSKVCELFILELTLRAWQETDNTKRKTMQKNDLILACSKCDMYDFLVDIIQREEVVADFEMNGENMDFQFRNLASNSLRNGDGNFMGDSMHQMDSSTSLDHNGNNIDSGTPNDDQVQIDSSIEFDQGTFLMQDSYYIDRKPEMNQDLYKTDM